MNEVNIQVGFSCREIIVDDFTFSCNINFEPDSDTLILCIHGLGCDKESFQHIFKYPDFEEYNILIPDLIGFGNSSKPSDFTYSLKDQAELLYKVVEKFNIKKIHLVAHSLGGAVALLMPKLIYKKVVSFANIEGNLVPADCDMFSRKIISTSFQEYNDHLFNHYNNLFTESMLLKFEKSTPYAMYYSAKSLVENTDNNSLLEKFKKLKIRRAYFFGEENMDSDVLMKLNGIERIMIAASGHEMMVENPDEFYNRLYDFINNIL